MVIALKSKSYCYLFVCFQLFKPSLDEGVTATISKGSTAITRC